MYKFLYYTEKAEKLLISDKNDENSDDEKNDHEIPTTPGSMENPISMYIIRMILFFLLNN
jgi:hypothetical protein